MATRLRVGLLTSLLVVGSLGPLSAQQTPTLTPGTRVRVGSVVGTLVSIDSASIVLRRPNGRVASLPRRQGTRVDVSAGPGRCSPGHRGTCLLIGFLGGAALGAGVGAIAVRNCRAALSPTDWDLCPFWYFGTVPAGVLVGTIVGATIGGEHWRRAGIPVHLSLAPGLPGALPWRAVHVGARLTF
jgi:hypothetical protein